MTEPQIADGPWHVAFLDTRRDEERWTPTGEFAGYASKGAVVHVTFKDAERTILVSRERGEQFAAEIAAREGTA